MQNDSGHLMRRYHPRWWLRLFAVGFFAFASTGLTQNLRGPTSEGVRPSPVSLLIWACLTVVGLTMVVHFFTTSVTLAADHIELRYFLVRKTLAVTEIRGRREYETTDSDGVKTRYVVLESRDPARPRLEFRRIYNFDSAFEAWLRQIPPVQL